VKSKYGSGESEAKPHKLKATAIVSPTLWPGSWGSENATTTVSLSNFFTVQGEPGEQGNVVQGFLTGYLIGELVGTGSDLKITGSFDTSVSANVNATFAEWTNPAEGHSMSKAVFLVDITRQPVDDNFRKPGLLTVGQQYAFTMDLNVHASKVGIYQALSRFYTEDFEFHADVEVVSEKAGNPTPTNEANDVDPNTNIEWEPGTDANSHDVYLGTSPNDVNDANDPNTSLGRGRQDSNSHCIGGLELGVTYYWRIDEVNETDPNIWKGDIWSFTTADHILVDDFESYGPPEPNLDVVWLPSGRASVYRSTYPYHYGDKAMKITYENSTGPYYSEVSRMYPDTQNWTKFDLEAISMWFRGNAANDAEQMYVALSDGDAPQHTAVVSYDDTNDLKSGIWHQWNIDLQEFVVTDDVNLANITEVCIGFGDRNYPTPGGSGTMYLDDIRLYPPRCVSGTGQPPADFSGDCITNLTDVGTMADNWLVSDYNVIAVQASQTPEESLVVWYKFNETSGYNAYDFSGNNYTATVSVDDAWDYSGYDGGCLDFNGLVNVSLPNDVGMFDNIDDQITISVWVKGDIYAQPQPLNSATLFEGRNAELMPMPVVRAICPDTDGNVNWLAGDDPNWDEMRWGGADSADWQDQWNHYAFVKNANEGFQDIYRNGVLVAQNRENFHSMDGIQEFTIGSKTDATIPVYRGKLDEFRIYNQALSHAQIVHLADKSEIRQPLVPLLSPKDPYVDGKIDLKDFAALAEDWLKEQLWP